MVSSNRFGVPSSVARTVTPCEPAASNVSVPEMTPLPESIDSPSGSPVADQVSQLPSGSEPLIGNEISAEQGIAGHVYASGRGHHATNAASDQFFFAGGARGLGSLLWRIGDIKLIDGLVVNGSAKAVGWFSGVIRHVQSGYLYHYAFAMIIGLLLLLGWFVNRWFVGL